MKVTPIFEKNYDAQEKIVINRGGTRSSKTYSLAQLSALWLMTGCYGEGQYCLSGTWATVRKYRTTLDNTVVKDFEEIMHNEGFYDKVEHNKTKKTYKFEERVVRFMGADDEQKLRGNKQKILYCNEANELNYRKEFFQLLIRTEKKIFLDFNPDDEDIWINTELEQKRKQQEQDVNVIVSNYKHNTYLSKSLVKEIELLEKTDKSFWTIYGLGEYGKIQGLVYEKGFKLCDSIDSRLDIVAIGIDFGYSSSPASAVEVYRDGDQLYFREVLHRVGVNNRELCEEIKRQGIDLRTKFIADSAEPKSIDELYAMGMNIHPAKKGKDSVNNGIDILKRFDFVVQKDSINLIKELKSYKWEIDKNGKATGKPIKMFDHCMDAIRYVALNELAESNKGVYKVR
jgi:phage terminase large subunit